MSQSERIYYIGKILKEQGSVSLKSIQEIFEVKRRTVLNDIQYIRQRLGIPLSYSNEKKGYVVEKPFDYFDYRDEKFLIFTILIEKISEIHELLPVYASDIIRDLRKKIRLPYSQLLDKISYQTEEIEIIDYHIFDQIIHAFITDKKIEFYYIDLNKNQTYRCINPLHLICYSGRWYCIGYDPSREGIRKFLFARMSSLKISQKSVDKKIDNEELQNYLSNSFGIYKTDECKRVKFRFYEPIYYLVSRQKWHKDQKVWTGKTKEGEMYMDIEIPVGAYDEIIGKLLRYGDKAEAISPPDFREAWLDKIRQMSRKYL